MLALVLPGETLEQALARIDARPDAARVLSSDDGQALLDAVWIADRERRRLERRVARKTARTDQER